MLGYFLLMSAFFQQAASEQAEVTLDMISKRYYSGYLPVSESYVEYEVRLTNEGDLALKNGVLSVSLVSEGNRTRSSATYSVPLLSPGEQKSMLLGPFKMEEEGRYSLLAQMKGVTFNYYHDSFIVYRQEAVQAALVAVLLILAGCGLVGFSQYRKSKAV
jgi:hypothetical protein